LCSAFDDFSITEEAFDPALNPIRAKVSSRAARFSVNDLDSRERRQPVHGVSAAKEKLAAQSAGGALSALGIGGIP